MDQIFISDLHLQVVIGVNDSERDIKQNVIINITIFKDISKCGESDNIKDTINYSTLTKAVMRYSETAHHYTLEALATGIARTCCVGFDIDRVIVRVDKPGALKLARAPCVQIERTKEYFGKLQNTVKRDDATHNQVTSEIPGCAYPIFEIAERILLMLLRYIALGSNLNDRGEYIKKALDMLRESGKVVATSFLYETPPAYVLDQPSFLNAVCMYETTLEPEPLLLYLQHIEKQLGRQPTVRYGPRTIDLDILYYGNRVIDTQNLVVPHPRIPERDFVLVPLLDIAPGLVHPVLHLTTQQLYENISLPTKNVGAKRKVIVHDQLLDLQAKTCIPTSISGWNLLHFSDGGNFLKVENAVDHASTLIKQGADIIDIGGQSTKPGALKISASEELERVLPVLKAVRERHPHIIISVDTFYSEVAKQTIAAGADMINDVTGGLYDPLMFQVVAALNVPIVIMHSIPSKRYEAQKKGETEPNSDIVREVSDHFQTQAMAAAAAGINQWQLIFDPGLGFAKVYQESIELLRRCKEITTLGYPVLVGPSRKGFVGHYVQESNPSGAARIWGTMACCGAAVGGGVCIVRVHDVAECKAVLSISDAIYR